MISWVRVHELRTEMGADDFREVFQVFLEEVEEVIARLRSDPQSSGPDEHFHFLKGSALNMGFVALAKICQRGERGAKAVDLVRVIEVFEASKKEFLCKAAHLGIAT